jgi:hypothetical protein
MFIKDAGLKDMEIAGRINRMLCTKAFSICEIADANSTDLTQNVRLIRATDSKGWDSISGIRGTYQGTMVKAARSLTGPKRRTTVL